ncbi:MAG: tetratricopeptide repeat protein [Candidatus Omnitrophota bacterium]|nr:tetratricopeptide repeat protein [Candidatus Omnitrophota bacterium]
MRNLSILVLIFGVAVSGCSKSYMAEKAFYEAEKVLGTISQDAPHEALDKAIAAFEVVAEKYPSTQKAAESLYLISNMKYKQGKFDEAREAMRTVVRNFGGMSEKTGAARFRVAQLYELEGNWIDAEKGYWETAEFHPLHAKGLYSPVHIVLHYRKAGDEKGAAAAYAKALDHFETLRNEIGPIEQVIGVKNSLATLHSIHGRGEEAVREWYSISQEFPDSRLAPTALMTAADYASRNGDYQTAINYYTEFMEKFPGHELGGKVGVLVGMTSEALGNLAEARVWYEKVLAEYFEAGTPQHADILLLLGRNYQHDEATWDKAQEIYDRIESEYPDSTAAMQIPLLRASQLKQTGAQDEADALLTEAVARYEALETETDDKELAGYAARFKTSALAQQGSWNELIEKVREYGAKEEGEARKGRWLFLEALLTQNRLKDDGKAADLYRTFLAKYPEHPLAARAKKELFTLNNRQATVANTQTPAI